MTKAWDLKDLVARFKEHGLPVLEKDTVIVANLMLDWVEESVKASDNKFDDFILMGMPLMRKYAEVMASKISPDKVAQTDDTLKQVQGEGPAATLAQNQIIPTLPNA